MSTDATQAAQQEPASSSAMETGTDAVASTSKSSSAPAIKVYKPPVGAVATPIPDLPDSYYNPTASELRAAHVGQTNKLRTLGVDTNFTTRAQRDKEAREREAKRVNRYPRTTIRIRFADRHQIETTFPSSRTLAAIYEFAKSCLDEGAQAEPFILYTPPRSELRLDDPKIQGKSLLDLQLAPSSVLNIRFTAKDSPFNDPAKPAPVSSRLLADAQDLPKHPSVDPTPEQIAASTADKGDTDEKKGNVLGSGGSSGAKVPKWLQKVSGKK